MLVQSEASQCFTYSNEAKTFCLQMKKLCYISIRIHAGNCLNKHENEHINVYKCINKKYLVVYYFLLYELNLIFSPFPIKNISFPLDDIKGKSKM